MRNHDKTLQDHLIDVMDYIDSGNDFHREYGICDNLTNVSDGEWGCTDLKPYFRMWPEFSGAESFPIKAPEGTRVDASRAFDDLPLWEGEYGAARRRLLDFLIDTVEY